MKMTRRIFAFSLLLAPIFFSIVGGSADKPAANPKYLVFVGTYTNKTESKGIYAYEFDADTGKLMAKGVAAETPDPSWVAVHPSGKYLYAANEAGKASTVSAFTVGAKSGKLALLNQLPSLGEDPCYLSFDKTGEYVFVANYTSGNVVVFPIGADGKLGAASANVHDEGKLGPNKERQDGPHAHWIETSPDNRFALVADLGLDEVLVYRFDADRGSLAPNAQVEVKAGSGPRHLAFSPDGKLSFSLNELASSLTWFLYDPLRGWLMELRTVSTLPKHYAGRNDAAEIALHPNGKFLYASNRGHDSIAVFAFNPGKGTLTLVAYVPTGGKEPRHFAIDPSGKYLLAENQLSNNIVVFKIDAATGSLTPTGQVVEVPSPVDIAFLQEN
jgi:6-phosphogluconolactonase